MRKIEVSDETLEKLLAIRQAFDWPNESTVVDYLLERFETLQQIRGLSDDCICPGFSLYDGGRLNDGTNDSHRAGGDHDHKKVGE